MIENRSFDDAKEWLTLKEAAKLFDRHVSNLYRWVKNKTLPYRYGEDARTIEVNKHAVRQAEGINFVNSKTRRKAA